MDYLDLKTRIQTRLARSNTDLVNSIPQWINEKQQEIVNYRDWWFLRVLKQASLTAGQTVYSLPTDYKSDAILYILRTGANNSKVSYDKLEMKSFEDALKYYLPDDTGEPETWILGKNSFSVRPIPDKAYIVRFSYYQYLVPLVNDGDTNILLTEYPQVVLAGVLAEGFAYLQETQDALYWEKKYANYLHDLEVKDTDRKLPSEFALSPRQDYFGNTLSSSKPRAGSDEYF